MATTRERLRELAAEHPQAGVAWGARQVGVTTERARQIANQEGLWPIRKSRLFTLRNPYPICTVCGKPLGDRASKTHQRCKRVKLICPICQQAFTRPASDLRRATTNPRYKRPFAHCGSPDCTKVWRQSNGRRMGKGNGKEA